MNSEELLKSISSLLNKHKDFLNDNPEMFFAIEDRLMKAIDDEDDEYSSSDYQTDNGDQEDDGYGESEYSNLFDETPSEEASIKTIKKESGVLK